MQFRSAWDGEPVYPKKTRWADRKHANYSAQMPVPELDKPGLELGSHDSACQYSQIGYLDLCVDVGRFRLRHPTSHHAQEST